MVENSDRGIFTYTLGGGVSVTKALWDGPLLITRKVGEGGGGKGRGGEELLLVRLFPTPSDLQEFFSTLTGISIFAFTP